MKSIRQIAKFRLFCVSVRCSVGWVRRMIEWTFLTHETYDRLLEIGDRPRPHRTLWLWYAHGCVLQRRHLRSPTAYVWRSGLKSIDGVGVEANNILSTRLDQEQWRTSDNSSNTHFNIYEFRWIESRQLDAFTSSVIGNDVKQATGSSCSNSSQWRIRAKNMCVWMEFNTTQQTEQKQRW